MRNIFRRRRVQPESGATLHIHRTLDGAAFIADAAGEPLDFDSLTDYTRSGISLASWVPLEGHYIAPLLIADRDYEAALAELAQSLTLAGWDARITDEGTSE